MKSRIMYIENKAAETLDARIGRVSFSKTMRTMYYRNLEFVKTGGGYKYNCIEVETGAHYWISGCKKDANDTLYGSGKHIPIDADIREEYWEAIRNRPELIGKESTNYCE